MKKAWPSSFFKNRLGLDISVLLIVKVAIILMAAFFVFGKSARLFVDDRVMQERFFAKEQGAGRF